MTDEARSADDGRGIAVNGDGVFEVAASGHPADDGRLRRDLRHFQATRTQRRFCKQHETVLRMTTMTTTTTTTTTLVQRPFSRTTRVSRYRNVTVLDFLEARMIKVVVTTGAIGRVKLQSNRSIPLLLIQFLPEAKDLSNCPLKSQLSQCGSLFVNVVTYRTR